MKTERTPLRNPAAGWARFYRGLARARRGDVAGALEDMERSIDRVKDLAGAYNELGRLYLALHGDEDPPRFARSKRSRSTSK